MADQLQKLVADRKEVVETVMEVFEKGTEVLASIVGDFFPIFAVVAPVVKLALDNVESKEAEFMKEQFQKVRERLDAVSEEIQRIDQEIRKSGADAAYFPVEENLNNQFRKFMDVLNAKPKFREVKKKLFLDHFAKTGGDKNLHTLYSAVTGDGFSGESVLEIALNYEEKSRRAVEDFCARLKNLFCLGLIALVGHAALKGAGEEEDVLRDWGERMKDVKAKMKAAVEACKSGFAAQAELDVGKRLRGEWIGQSPAELAGFVAAFLTRKYDWVCWSVRAYARSGGCLGNLLHGRKDEGVCGRNHFSFDGLVRVVVSYSLGPGVIDKDGLRGLIKAQGRTRDLEKLARWIHAGRPHCLVHVVSKRWEVAVQAGSFPANCRFYQRHRNAHIYVHSE